MKFLNWSKEAEAGLISTMVAVKDILGTCKYMDVTEQDKEILVEIITSRGE